jgi:hypothetical protein
MKETNGGIAMRDSGDARATAKRTWPLGGGGLYLAIPAAGVLFVAIATFAFAFPPLQDWPEWVFQAEVFNRLVHGELAQSFQLKDYPVPYAGVQLLTSGLIAAIGAIAAARVVVILYLGVGVGLLGRLIARRAIDPYLGWSIGICAVLLNTSFFNGYVGWQFGLLLIVAYLGRDRRQPESALAIAGLTVGAFLLHGMAYLALMVFIACDAWYERTARRVAIACLPSVTLAAWYALASRAHPVYAGPAMGEAHAGVAARLAKTVYRVVKLGPYHNFVVGGVGDGERFGRWFVALGALTCLAVLVNVAVVWAATIRKKIGSKADRPTLFASALVALTALALPPFTFGIVNPGERLLSPALLGIIAALPTAAASLPAIQRAGRALAIAVLAGTALSAVSLFGWLGNEPFLASEPSKMANNKPFQHRPFMHFDRLVWLTEWPSATRPVPALVFETGLVRNGK